MENVDFQNPSTPPDLTASCEQSPAEVSHNSIHNHHTEKYTLYIRDSMLKHGTKMASLSQKALVFAYPGATAPVTKVFDLTNVLYFQNQFDEYCHWADELLIISILIINWVYFYF